MPGGSKQKPIETPPGGRPVFGRNAKGNPICNSPLRNKPGRFCQTSVGLFPNGRCELHGGPTPHGDALPQTKHGKRAKYMPPRLTEHFREALSDPELMSLNEDIATAEARIVDLLSRADKGESKALYGRMLSAYYDVDEAWAEGDTKQMYKALKQLKAQIFAAKQDFETWDEAGRWAERKRKLIETQAKMHQMVRADQFMVLVDALRESVRENVSDKRELAAIMRSMARILNRPERGGS